MEKKQSSLDYLIEQLEGENNRIAMVVGVKKYNSIIQQAKAMHKEEIINFTTDWHHNGLLSLGVLVSTSVEEHYNKTFNQ